MELTTKTAFKCRIVPFSVGGDTGFFQLMSGADRDKWVKAIGSETGESALEMYAGFVINHLCEADGKLIFKSRDELIGLADAMLIEALFSACLKANGLSKEGRDEAKKD